MSLPLSLVAKSRGGTNDYLGSFIRGESGISERRLTFVLLFLKRQMKFPPEFEAM